MTDLQNLKQSMRRFYESNENYHRLISQQEREGFHYDHLLERLIDDCSSGGTAPRVLDVASGTGHYVEASERFGAVAFGVDLSGHACRMAKSRTPRAVVCHSDAEFLPFRGNTFDIVLCLQLLEHVTAPENVLGEITRVLKPGGYLFLSAPNMLGGSPLSRTIRAVIQRFSGEIKDLRPLSADVSRRWEQATSTKEVADLDACNRTNIFQALNMVNRNGLVVEYLDTIRHPAKYNRLGYFLARLRHHLPIVRFAGVNYKILAKKAVARGMGERNRPENSS